MERTSRLLGALAVLALVLGVLTTSHAYGAASTTPRVTGTLFNNRPGLGFSVRRGASFMIGVAAVDTTSNDYMVEFLPNWSQVVQLGQTCQGLYNDSPSPDTPACEYDNTTTSLRTTTHTRGMFAVTAPVGSHVSFAVCARPFTNTKSGGSCRTFHLRIT